EAGLVLLEGDVRYYGESEAQQFISGHINIEIVYSAYNNLFFQGNAIKRLPNHLDLRGNLTFNGGGALDGASTFLEFISVVNQTINHPSLVVNTLQIRKDEGILFFEGDITVIGHYTMNSGIVDFKDNEFNVNVSGDGSYSYYDGTWKNL